MATMNERTHRLLQRRTVGGFVAGLSLAVSGACIARLPLAAQVKSSQNSQATTGSAVSAGVPLMPQPLIIAGGDLLEIQVFATPELSGRMRVDQFGDLNLSLGGSLHVTGMTAAQAGIAIEDRLRSAHIMRDPHVSVYVTEYTSQMVTVVGEVRKPGPVPLYGSQTLYDVLGAAGGITGTAGGTITISHRDDRSSPQVIHVHTPNYSEVEHLTHIRPGDTVVVSQADLVYVLGAVTKQGSVPMPNGASLSVLNVLSLSAGLTPIAAASKAAIVRQAPDGATITVNVDLRRIMRREDPDVLMTASDILVVPVSNRKYIEQLILPSIATTATSSAITSIIVR